MTLCGSACGIRAICCAGRIRTDADGHMKPALYQLSYRATDDSIHIEALRYHAICASWLHPTACRRPKHFDVEREAEFESAASTLATSRSTS